MIDQAEDDGPIEVHLPDGGHLIVAIEDHTIRTSAVCDELIRALVWTDGSEHDIERAVVAEAQALGLRCTTSSGHHSTIVAIAAGTAASSAFELHRVQNPDGQPDAGASSPHEPVRPSALAGSRSGPDR